MTTVRFQASISSRASFTSLEKRRASSRIRSDWRRSIASVGINSVPTPIAVAPANMKPAAVCWFTPPAAIKGICGKAVFSALMYLSPPTGPQGKTLTKSPPAVHDSTTSVGASAPGRTAMFCLATNSTTAGLKDGAVMKHAPASIHFGAVSTSRTVPPQL